MASRYFKPRARVFGVLVEGASIHCGRRSTLQHGKSGSCSPFEWHDTLDLPKRKRGIYGPYASNTRKLHTKREATLGPKSPSQILNKEIGKATGILRLERVPEEKTVQEALKICENLAKRLTRPIEPREISATTPEQTATSDLLSLEESSQQLPKTTTKTSLPAAPSRSDDASLVSTAAYRILTDPKVFITPTLLSIYINTQNILGRPQSFPQIFDYYASKPIPQPGKLPFLYKDPTPDRASSAVPYDLALSALRAGIEKKDLSLCINIINTTVCTTAYKRSKAIRKALLPATGLALVPAAAYVLASQLALLQRSMDVQTATQIFFAGFLAYVGFTATIGVVAIATSNDQMNRITWAKGTSLRERWLREEERAMIDQVANAWGFQETFMRGEEDSDEWEELREWAGQRGLILDNPELMEGME